jgi:ABC-type bacteriocin/lantibiotic exporter with double-glycine peptidase domain
MNYLKKIFNLLSSKAKKKSIFLLVMFCIMALLDIVGVASIMPFMATLANPELIKTNVYLNDFFHFLNFENPKSFLFFLGFLSFAFLLISLIFKAITTYLQSNFVFMQEYEIGVRLLEGYLRQPYAWFLGRNSSDLSKTILSEVAAVLNGAIIPAMILISQGLVVIMMLIFLIVINPKLIIVVASVIVIFYIFVFFSINKFLLRIGKEKVYVNKNRFLTLNETFGSVKEVKLGESEMKFVYQFSKYAIPFAKQQSYLQSLSYLPRLALEAIGFGGLLLIILYLMNNTQHFDLIIPAIALYAIAGYRLLPAFQNIFSALTKLRFAKPALDLLNAELSNLSFSRSKIGKIVKMKIKDNIELKNISFNYPGSSKLSIKDISMKIKINNNIGIVGVTGSGKTTLADIILFLLTTDKGAIFVDGKPINSKNYREWQKIIGYVPQQIYIADDTVSANIAYGIPPESVNKAAIKRSAKIANIHEFITKELKDGYKTILGERGKKLSGGQRQRIGIARALYNAPSILILDEATSALDNITERAVMNKINNLNKKITIIHIAHRLSTVRHCDQIYVLEKGQIKAHGTYNKLQSNSKIFREMLVN